MEPVHPQDALRCPALDPDPWTQPWLQLQAAVCQDFSKSVYVWLLLNPPQGTSAPGGAGGQPCFGGAGARVPPLGGVEQAAPPGSGSTGSIHCEGTGSGRRGPAWGTEGGEHSWGLRGRPWLGAGGGTCVGPSGGKSQQVAVPPSLASSPVIQDGQGPDSRTGPVPPGFACLLLLPEFLF